MKQILDEQNSPDLQVLAKNFLKELSLTSTPILLHYNFSQSCCWIFFGRGCVRRRGIWDHEAEILGSRTARSWIRSDALGSTRPVHVHVHEHALTSCMLPACARSTQTDRRVSSCSVISLSASWFYFLVFYLLLSFRQQGGLSNSLTTLITVGSDDNGIPTEFLPAVFQVSSPECSRRKVIIIKL